MQHPEQELRDTEISLKVKSVKKSAVNVALRKLADIGFITRYLRGRQAFNKINESSLITHFKVISNIIAIKELTDKLEPLCSKIILFGSRAEGEHTSESDFDIFVVTIRGDDVNRAIRKHPLAEKIQIVIKTPEQMLAFDEESPVFQKQVKKGIVLWAQK